MKLLAKDLLQEELEEKQDWNVPESSGTAQRIEQLKEAIQELDDLDTRLNCSNCKHDISLEELRKLSDEASLNYFERCTSCSNYYQSKFEGK